MEAAASWAAWDQPTERASCAWKTASRRDIEDVWSALTDPSRLARWYGEVEGDLRPGGEYHARLFSSGWEGTGRVEACEPPQRLLVRIKDADEPDEQDIEVTLTADGDQTIVVWEERGMPVDLLSAYGAGVQIHVEDLADHLAGTRAPRRRQGAVGRAPSRLSRPDRPMSSPDTPASVTGEDAGHSPHCSRLSASSASYTPRSPRGRDDASNRRRAAITSTRQKESPPNKESANG